MPNQGGMDHHWTSFFGHVERIRSTLRDGLSDERDIRHAVANALQLATTLFELEIRRIPGPSIALR